MISPRDRAEECLFGIGFHRMPKRPHIHVWPEFPNPTPEFTPDPTYVMHRCGIAITAMTHEGVTDFIEIEKNRVWMSQKHGITVKLHGTHGYVDMRVVIIFEKT
jgi:hypothetical protein